MENLWVCWVHFHIFVLIFTIPNCRLVDWEWAMAAPPDVEFNRGFQFLRDHPVAKTLLDKKLKERGLLCFEDDEKRQDISKIERLVSRITYMSYYYQEDKLREAAQDYCSQIQQILSKYKIRF